MPTPNIFPQSATATATVRSAGLGTPSALRRRPSTAARTALSTTPSQDNVTSAQPGYRHPIYVAVSDPDEHYARAKAAGAAITRELCDQPYGSREYGARDLEGNAWSFGTYNPHDA